MDRVASRTTCITACSSHSEHLYNQTNQVHCTCTCASYFHQKCFSTLQFRLYCVFLPLPPSLQEVAEILDVGGSESTYKDSNIFLKGTQSANPHNDYSQHFVDIGQRPQNFIRDVGKWAGLELHPGLV